MQSQAFHVLSLSFIQPSAVPATHGPFLPLAPRARAQIRPRVKVLLSTKQEDGSSEPCFVVPRTNEDFRLLPWEAESLTTF